MITDMLKSITSDQVATYHLDGVVLLPAMFDSEWIESLKKGLVANCNDPTDRSRVWDRDSMGHTMFHDNQAWLRIGEYRQFIFE